MANVQMEGGGVPTNVLIIVTVIVCAALAGLFLFVNKFFAASTPAGGSQVAEDDQPVVKAKKEKKKGLGLKKLRQNRQEQQEQVEEDQVAVVEPMNDDDELADLTIEEDIDDVRRQGKRVMGVKKLMKMEAKVERQQAQAAMVKEREEKKARDEELWQQELANRAAADAAEKAEEEARMQKIQERKAKEQAEYEALKSSGIFEVEESGTMEEDAIDAEGMMEGFVDFIKKTKIVMLEELASKFRMKTKDAIERLKTLEESGRITGVMDDRGKYIYVSPEEMTAVVKFIKQRGRISISELAENSHKLISLKGQQTPQTATAIAT
eukprot:m.58154 g.58154  ORF g.58154 m.58154 type:complete len:323 (+) comp22509_c1_seq1:200-1168(+)